MIQLMTIEQAVPSGLRIMPTTSSAALTPLMVPSIQSPRENADAESAAPSIIFRPLVPLAKESKLVKTPRSVLPGSTTSAVIGSSCRSRRSAAPTVSSMKVKVSARPLMLSAQSPSAPSIADAATWPAPCSGNMNGPTSSEPMLPNMPEVKLTWLAAAVA